MATSLASHKARRVAAGFAYASAAQALINAYVELAAYDATVSNGNIGGGQQLTFGETPVIPGHGQFLRNIPSLTSGDHIGTLIANRVQQLLAS